VEISNEDLEDLRRAKRLLQTTTFAARMAGAVGRPLEQLTASLPRGVTEAIFAAVNKALEASLDVAIRSLGGRRVNRANAIHKLAVGASGAIGGALGLPAVALELPASTTIMLRSIAEIARSEGESLESPEARLACLQVFALGGPGKQDDALDTSYFAVRAAMATTLEEAAKYVTTHGVTRKGAPVFVRLLTQISTRFGVPVSQKLVAQTVPVIGAAGGAALNVIFLATFQDLARGHFIVRRLERTYGPDTVRVVYATLQGD
jgi:hypothetical protein